MIYAVPLSENFIDVFIEKILLHNLKNNDLSKNIIVFPNRRSFLFLRKKLALRFKKPFISPPTFTIDEFIEKIVTEEYPDIRRIDNLDAIWILYNISNELNINFSNQENSFESFYQYGKKILSFLNMIDTENIPDSKLKAITPKDIGYEEIPEEMNKLLNNIILIRNSFHNILQEKKLFTRGFLYLKAIKMIDYFNMENFDKIYFAGLFALTNVEKEIVKKLYFNGKAEYIINSDVKNNKIENWSILQKIKDEIFPEEDIQEISLNKNNNSPEINIYQAFDTHSEMIHGINILKSISLKNTLIVIPRAENLFPFLSIALENISEISTYNISLSYPLIRTSLFSLLKNIISINLNKRYAENKVLYRTKLYLNLISNPFVKNISADKYKILRTYFNTLLKAFNGNIKDFELAGRIYISLEEFENSSSILENIKNDLKNEYTLLEIKNIIKNFHRLFFKNFTEKDISLLEIIRNLEDIIAFILENSNIKSYILSGELFNRIFEILFNLSNVSFKDIKLKIETIFYILDSYLTEAELSFATTPLQDIEILGMLETRNLNFDNVIIFDVQDGIIPLNKSIDTLIPEQIYKYLKLPAYKEKEEMNRFYFYRIIKSAKQTHLLYIEDDNLIRSRYIEEIIWEKEKSSKKIGLFKINNISFPININPQQEILSIKKDKNILNKLSNMEFSSTSIDTYIKCKLQFYFKYILKLEEENKIEEETDNLKSGSIIHEILKNTYLPFKGKIITYENKKDVLDSFYNATEKEFNKLPLTPQNYLLKKIIEKRLSIFIDYDLTERDSIKIIDTEKGIKIDYNFNEEQKIKLKGYIDKIEFRNGEYFIIDYKSGSSSYYKKVNKVDFNLNMEEIHKNVISLQMPIYTILYLNKNKEIENLEAKYIFLKNIPNNIKEMFLKFYTIKNEKKLKKDEKKFNEIFPFYKKVLDTTIKDIFSLETNFEPYEEMDEKECLNCPYRNICRYY